MTLLTCGDLPAKTTVVMINRLWTALLRYPPRLLLRDGARLASEVPGLGVALRVMGETRRATPWLLAHRRRLPQRVTTQVELLRAT